MVKDNRSTQFDNEDLNLTLMIEECAEVIHIISKIKRFGKDDPHPERDNIPKIELLHKELGDLFCIVEIMAYHNYIDLDQVDTYATQKFDKLKKYYRINK